MKTAWGIALMALCLAITAFPGDRTCAQNTEIDVVQQDLDAAKTARMQAVNDAIATMSAAFDVQIKSSDTDANTARILSDQKAIFIGNGQLPSSPLMSRAAAVFLQSTKDANNKMVDAYYTAIEGFNKESKPDLASQARRERDALLSAPGGSFHAAQVPTSPIPTPEAIGKELDAAKTQYRLATANDTAVLLEAIDKRINAATDAGNLALVKALQGVRTTAATVGTVPDDAKDAAVVVAKKAYENAIAADKANLNEAFQNAVRDYTRARQIDKAQSTQDELDALDLVDSASHDRGPGLILHLNFSPQYVNSLDKNIVVDLSEARHGASLQKVSIVKDSGVGWAAEFDGINTSVSLGSDSAFQMSTEMTVMARIMSTGNINEFADIVAKEDWGTGANGYALRLSEGQANFTLGMPGWPSVGVAYRLQPNAWHSIAGTYDGNVMRLYVDGQVVASKAQRGRIAQSKYPLMVGASPYTDDRKFEGRISEVNVYDRALSATEVSELDISKRSDISPPPP